LDNVVERHFLDPEVRRALYEQLIRPAALHLGDKRRLFLIPHGPLHYIPFQALIAPDGDTLLREDGPEISRALSATLLLSPAQAAPPPAPRTCLALGYNGGGDAPLRLAEAEARRVARLTGGHALAGPAAKKSALFAEAFDYQRLHISCHGEFVPEEPLSSLLALAAGERLTALEVLAQLRLRCDLVTLSACESGLSGVRRGDELTGLMRAFLQAGARTLVTSLWRVDERSTLTLMERFYAALEAGAPYAGALRAAQLQLRQRPQFRDPYYWAPFTLIETQVS
jgi:CHAT domain-containing protein